ncbi:MAG: ribonuclease P protein component [bacterium]|nr:ribonuclease P protein component [bacterium]MDD4152336.1 ribonuclease P protein component [bacterium]MDD4557537.1 ribonuclease P protein component [bacterium]
MRRESLKRRREFTDLYQRGYRYSNALLVLRVIHTEEDKQGVGLAVSKKIGSAVLRNRVKRLLREAVRQEIEEVVSRVNLLLIARKGIESATAQSIKAAVKELFKRAHLYKADVG